MKSEGLVKMFVAPRRTGPPSPSPPPTCLRKHFVLVLVFTGFPKNMEGKAAIHKNPTTQSILDAVVCLLFMVISRLASKSVTAKAALTSSTTPSVVPVNINTNPPRCEPVVNMASLHTTPTSRRILKKVFETQSKISRNLETDKY